MAARCTLGSGFALYVGLGSACTVATMAAGCVSAPSSADFLAVGFRTPEQTFHTFQTAVRADDPALEVRCFSAGFRRQNDLSQFNYRTFRDELRRANPLLRKGLADARIDSPVERRGRRAHLLASSHGRHLAIDLVLDDYAEVWMEGAPIVDESLSFDEHTGTQSADDGTRWIFGRVPLPEGADPARVTELTFGREWKIDGITTVEDPSPQRAPAAHDS